MDQLSSFTIIKVFWGKKITFEGSMNKTDSQELKILISHNISIPLGFQKNSCGQTLHV